MVSSTLTFLTLSPQLDRQGKPTRKLLMAWTEPPAQVVASPPYALAVMPNKQQIEVRVPPMQESWEPPINERKSFYLPWDTWAKFLLFVSKRNPPS